jgi:hypothetical protein
VTPALPKRLRPGELLTQFKTKQWQAHTILGLLDYRLSSNNEKQRKLLLENI